jgi:hypothetical protein
VTLVVFYGPAIGGGRFLYRDTGRMHVPVKQFIGEELRAGRPAAWNPYYGMGMPIVGAAVDAPLHPFTALTVVFPTQVAVTLWVLLSHLVAGLGAWVWARRLGAGRGSALAGGLAFALTGFLVSSSDNLTYLTTIATVPWVFAAGDLWIARGGPGPLAALALASALCAAAGDPQGWGLAVAGTALFALLIPPGEEPWRRRTLRAALGVVACAAAAAPAILPLLQWLPHSSRASALDAVTLSRWNLAPLRLVELLVPGVLQDGGAVTVSPLHLQLADPTSSTPWVASVYVGVAVAALAVAAAARGVKGRLLVALSLIALWGALGHHAGFGQLAAHAPILRGFRYWEKLAVWAALFLSAAAAIGVEALVADARLARRMAVAAAGFAAVALLVSLLTDPVAASIASATGRPGAMEIAPQLAENLRDGLLHAGAVAAAFAAAAWMLSRGRLPGALAVLAAIVALDLAGANVRAYHLHVAEADRPRSALAAWLQARRDLGRVVTPFEPLKARRGFSASESLNYYGALTLSSAWNVAYRVGNFDPYSGPVPARLRDVNDPLAPNLLVPNVGLWGFGYVVVPGGPKEAATANVPPSAPIVARDESVPAFLFEIPHRARAYVAREVSEVDPRGALAFALDAASAGSDRTVVEGPLPTGLPIGEGSAEVVRDEPTAVDVRVVVPGGPALLVLNDAFAPGWRAAVDGREQPIVAANYLARGVWLPAGEHRVAFRYATPGLAEGLALAALAATAIGVWALRRRRADGRSEAARPAR